MRRKTRMFLAVVLTAAFVFALPGTVYAQEYIVVDKNYIGRITLSTNPVEVWREVSGNGLSSSTAILYEISLGTTLTINTTGFEFHSNGHYHAEVEAWGDWAFESIRERVADYGFRDAAHYVYSDRPLGEYGSPFEFVEQLIWGSPYFGWYYGAAVSHFTFDTPGVFFVYIVYSSGDSIGGQEAFWAGTFVPPTVTSIVYMLFDVVDGTPQPPEAPSTLAAPAADGVNVTINGTLQAFEVPPQIIEGRTMLPLRAIGEALDMEVSFNSATSTATLTADGVEITHVIHTNQVTVNGETQTFDASSTIVDGRTLLPLRMLAEAIGANVEWDGTTRTAIITTN